MTEFQLSPGPLWGGGGAGKVFSCQRNTTRQVDMATGEDVETTTANACYTGWQTDYGGMFHRYCTCPGRSGRKLLSSGDDAQAYDACTCPPYDDAGARRLLAHVQEEPEEPFEQKWSWLKTMVQKTADSQSGTVVRCWAARPSIRSTAGGQGSSSSLRCVFLFL
jgi:hypothetical protein